jgi:uncharacterized protein with HEPN domain
MRPEQRDQAYLYDMLRAAQDIVEFTRGIDYDAFFQDKKTRLAVERQLLVVGEAAYHVTERFRSAHPAIPWTKIIGQRNVLAHDYGEVLLERIWLVTQRDVPPLVGQLAQLLGESTQ